MNSFHQCSEIDVHSFDLNTPKIRDENSGIIGSFYNYEDMYLYLDLPNVMVLGVLWNKKHPGVSCDDANRSCNCKADLCVSSTLTYTLAQTSRVMARIAGSLLILCLSWVYGTSAFVLIPLHFTNQLQEAAKIIFPTINEIVHKEEVKVPVTLGVMSRCPDALLCETIFDRVLAQVSPKVNLSLSFIG